MSLTLGHLTASNISADNVISQRNTVYEGGVFVVDIRIPKDYPMVAPNLCFETKVFHARVGEAGSICSHIFNSLPGLTDASYINSQRDGWRTAGHWSPSKMISTCEINHIEEWN
jgi:ubiquitin-protein ligase